MHVAHLSLTDYRSYESVDLELAAGASAFIGPNGQGKTNLVEAVHYVATQASHRVSADAPLVRAGADQAIVRTTICRGDRRAVVEIEINPGRPNRARLNQSGVTRSRDVVGILRSVLFSPDDLALVKGEPTDRRRFLDDLLVLRQPRFAAVRSDYDRVLKQRNSLLKTASGRATGRRNESAMSTLDVWDAHLARAGAELLAARLALVDDLLPHVARHYAEIATTGGDDESAVAGVGYQPSYEVPPAMRDRADLEGGLLAELERRRSDELDRGITLVGPHRDEMTLTIGSFPAKGYASHGESWSLALALRLASFDLLRDDGDDPVLILDDVFAELDDLRRARLAALVRDTEQVLVTAAVSDDVPREFAAERFEVRDGKVAPVG